MSLYATKDAAGTLRIIMDDEAKKSGLFVEVPDLPQALRDGCAIVPVRIIEEPAQGEEA